MNIRLQTYTLYGLQVHSEIPLPAHPAPNGLPPDLRVHWDGRKPISAPPAGETLSQLLLPDGRGYTLVDTGADYILHFHQTGEFHIARDLRSVRVQLAPEIAPDIAGLLLVGNIMACLFTLSGEPVLHASAVETNGAALAFLGASGMGKSSLAGLLCAHGARFITDDLLRLQPDGEQWRCYPGAGHLRLRQNAAAALGENFPADLQSAAADERVAVWFDGGAGGWHFGSDSRLDQQILPRLAAIIIPRLSRECRALELERIPTAKALLYLMAFPRIQESSRKEQRQRRLDFLGRIAASVPIFAAEIPWGLPFPRELADSLVEGVRVTPKVSMEEQWNPTKFLNSI